MIHKLFKKIEVRTFNNLTIESILPGYEIGYPNEARHFIKIYLIYRSYPYQNLVTQKTIQDILIEFTLQPDDVAKHMQQWRTFMLAKKGSKFIVTLQLCNEGQNYEDPYFLEDLLHLNFLLATPYLSL